MPFLQRIFAAVMLFSSVFLLFSSAVYGLATPEEAEAGKVQGFTGPWTTEPNGDVLTATFCYCEYPPIIESVSGPAHWYQFEYYNRHHNTTFILTSACPDGDIGFDKTCVPSDKAKVKSMDLLAGYTMAKTCKLWKGYEESIDDHFKGTQFEFCYLPNHKHNEDYISFNKQKRNLGANGHQPRLYQEANQTCQNMCKEYLDMPLLDIHFYPPSHQVFWRLDDMCEDCE